MTVYLKTLVTLIFLICQELLSRQFHCEKLRPIIIWTNYLYLTDFKNKSDDSFSFFTIK